MHLYEKGMQRKAVGLLVAKNYAMLLYNRGEVERAAEVIKDHVPQGFLRNIALSWFVAELPCGPSRVRELCNQMPEKPADFRVAWQCIFLCYLGQKEMVPNVLRTFRSNSDRVPGRQAPGFDVLLDFLKEPGTEAEKKILQGVRHSKSGLTFWHFNIGVVRLGEGDRASARVHFEASIRAHDPYAPNYKIGRAFLARMKKDPTWPPWIPTKNDKAKPKG